MFLDIWRLYTYKKWEDNLPVNLGRRRLLNISLGNLWILISCCLSLMPRPVYPVEKPPAMDGCYCKVFKDMALILCNLLWIVPENVPQLGNTLSFLSVHFVKQTSWLWLYFKCLESLYFVWSSLFPWTLLVYLLIKKIILAARIINTAVRTREINFTKHSCSHARVLESKMRQDLIDYTFHSKNSL